MAYISQVEYENASEEVKAQFDDQIKKHGRITNMKKTLLHSVPAFKALMEWYPLEKEVEKFLGERATNFYCYAISTQNQCLICSTFFRKILVDLKIDFDHFTFTEEENEIIEYGRFLVQDPANIPEELFTKLEKRYTQEQIVLLTAFGSMMIATNLINTALKVELDDILVPYTKRG
jgi:hypothetical protein